MSTEGYMNTVEEAIATHISESDATLLPKTTHVLLNLDGDVWEYDNNNNPIVTLKITPSTDRELLQGRQLGGASTKKIGIFISIFFTAVLYHNINTTANQDKYKTAMDLADKIKEYLSKSKDETSGIQYYYEITARKVRSGMQNVAKVIIEGNVFVRRPFST